MKDEIKDLICVLIGLQVGTQATKTGVRKLKKTDD